jgi:hypothetical protein
VNVDGATVRIDDALVGESPLAPLELAPGRHVVVVTREGYASQRREVEVGPGESERLDVTLVSFADAGGSGGGGEVAPGPGGAEPQWYERWEVWAGVGGGVVLLGVIVGVSVAVASSGAPASQDPTGIMLPPIR